MCSSAAQVRARAEKLVAQLGESLGQGKDLQCEVVEGESIAGGGAAPAAALPTALIACTSRHHSAEELASRLRQTKPPVIARVEEGRVLLDLRTVFPEQDAVLAAALRQI